MGFNHRFLLYLNQACPLKPLMVAAVIVFSFINSAASCPLEILFS